MTISPKLGRRLTVTMIEAGFGDSILVEACDGISPPRLALIDSNDSAESPLSRCYISRYLERTGRSSVTYPLFDFVLATHAHADHIRGLRKSIYKFGTDRLYSAKFDPHNSPAMAKLLQWGASTFNASNQRVCQSHQYISRGNTLPALGPVTISVLWPPPHAPWPKSNENDNSVVLSLTLDQVRLVLTGDCEVENWDTNKADFVQLPSNVRMVQIPHHGARNGLISASGKTPLLQEIASRNAKHPLATVMMGMSCHAHPHGHPHNDIIVELDRQGIDYYRSDEGYHLGFSTDGQDVSVKWSR